MHSKSSAGDLKFFQEKIDFNLRNWIENAASSNFI